MILKKISNKGCAVAAGTLFTEEKTANHACFYLIS